MTAGWPGEQAPISCTDECDKLGADSELSGMRLRQRVLSSCAGVVYIVIAFTEYGTLRFIVSDK